VRDSGEGLRKVREMRRRCKGREQEGRRIEKRVGMEWKRGGALQWHFFCPTSSPNPTPAGTRADFGYNIHTTFFIVVHASFVRRNCSQNLN